MSVRQTDVFDRFTKVPKLEERLELPNQSFTKALLYQLSYSSEFIFSGDRRIRTILTQSVKTCTAKHESNQGPQRAPPRLIHPSI